MNLLSALTRQLPQEDQPLEIHHDGKRIPIELEHFGDKVSKIAISVDPPSIVINQDNPFYMGHAVNNWLRGERTPSLDQGLTLAF